MDVSKSGRYSKTLRNGRCEPVAFVAEAFGRNDFLPENTRPL